jgi:hypothetical protein
MIFQFNPSILISIYNIFQFSPSTIDFLFCFFFSFVKIFMLSILSFRSILCFCFFNNKKKIQFGPSSFDFLVFFS